MGITTSAGHQTHKLWINEAQEEYKLDCSSNPLLVRFDEGNWLLKEWTFNKSAEELMYQLKKDDATGRIWAASELVKIKGNAGVMEALRSSAQSDPFWAVRLSAIEALGQTKEPDLTEFIKSRCMDESSKVRTAALRVLGDFQDRNLNAFFQERFQEDDSYAAQAEALLSLGKCGSSRHLAFLQEAAAMPSPRNVIRRAAEAAEKQIKEK